MKEYIEREAALEILKRNPIGTWRGAPVYSEEIKSAADEIGDLPAADVAEVRHGWWEIKVLAFSRCKKISCSICGYSENRGPAWDEGYGLANDCLNCGARMDGEDEHEAD